MEIPAKEGSDLYTGQEKHCVSEILAANQNVIDVEAAFSIGSDPRIDFVAIQKSGASLKLAFFETKHFVNSE